MLILGPSAQDLAPLLKSPLMLGKATSNVKQNIQERLKIARQNEQFAWMYTSAQQFIDNGDNASARDQLQMLWQDAPYYGDPAGLSKVLGLPAALNYEQAIATEQVRLEQERKEQERQERERKEQERLARERQERERLEQERLTRERQEQERLARERLTRERQEQERLTRERQERERLRQEQVVAKQKSNKRILIIVMIAVVILGIAGAGVVYGVIYGAGVGAGVGIYEMIGAGAGVIIGIRVERGEAVKDVGVAVIGVALFGGIIAIAAAAGARAGAGVGIGVVYVVVAVVGGAIGVKLRKNS